MKRTSALKIGALALIGIGVGAAAVLFIPMKFFPAVTSVAIAGLTDDQKECVFEAGLKLPRPGAVITASRVRPDVPPEAAELVTKRRQARK